MKIKPKIYAELLLESIKEKADSKKVAANFWYMLQKNKQYHDLPKILDELEKVYAEKEGFVIADVESGKELNSQELEEIKKKLAASCHSCEGRNLKDSGSQATGRNDNIILKTKLNPAVTGIIAKVEGKVIDLSVENTILKLRKKLNT